jgi:hypothetical protein
MQDIFAFQSRALQMWLDAWETHAATVATISARMPILMATASGMGNRNDHQETQNMVTEKLQAAAQGAQAGVFESARVAMKVMSGQSTSPFAVAAHFMDVAEAAGGPANVKVRANAKRLASR